MSIAGLFLLCAACCLGGGATSRQTHRLDPLGISMDLPTSHTGGASGTGYLFTSSDGSSTIQISAAAAGGPANTRTATEIVPGAVVQWSRAVSAGGMTGLESRLDDPMRMRTHWVGAFDGPRGVVWVDLSTATSWVPGPTDGDVAWTTLRDGIRAAP